MRRERGKNSSRLNVLLAALLILPAGLCRADDLPKPRIKVESPLYDFGTVAQGVRVTHNFAVQNTGNADLMLHRIVPACGCTAASTSGDVIKPGEKGQIKVDLDTSDFSGDKLKLIRVFSNDMDEPSVSLTLKGNIEPSVVIDPQRVTFNGAVRGVPGASESRRVTVRVKPEAGLQISEVKSFSKFVSVKMIEQSPLSAAFDVILDTTAPAGELRDRLVLNFKGSKSMSLNVPVFATIEGSLRLNPGTVSFGILEGEAPIARSAKIENLSANPIAIKKVSSSDPAVSADFATIKEGQNYVLHVTLDPKKVTKDLRALVTVTTDSKTEAPLSLNVYGILPPKS